MPSQSVHFEKERGVTEVTVTHGIAHFVVRLPAGEEEAQTGARRLTLLKVLAEASVPVFMMKLHPGAMSFAVRENDAIAAGETLLKERAEDLIASYTVQKDLALTAIVAGAMRDLSGVMAAIYEALVGQDITVCQTADAYNAVHVLIPGSDAERAQAALCERFEVGAWEGARKTAPLAEGVGLRSL